VLNFSTILKLAASVPLPEPPLLPEYGTHKVSTMCVGVCGCGCGWVGGCGCGCGCGCAKSDNRTRAPTRWAQSVRTLINILRHSYDI
jgi:hypothetical protein